tara:strand:- start:181 stop:612 length:432 start_codon:yes stop_codon:yes gene_type:complete
MRKHIVLLLITGMVWAQTNFDKLVLKDGTEYLGEYYTSANHTEKDIIYFKSQEALSIQPVSVKLIQKLKLKDGTILTNGILGFRAYAKLNTEEKAIYNDLKKRHSRQFTCFAITLALVALTFSVNSGGSTSNGKVFLGDGPPI